VLVAGPEVNAQRPIVALDSRQVDVVAIDAECQQLQAATVQRHLFGGAPEHACEVRRGVDDHQVVTELDRHHDVMQVPGLGEHGGSHDRSRKWPISSSTMSTSSMVL
jgi:hypothetical protein